MQVEACPTLPTVQSSESLAVEVCIAGGHADLERACLQLFEWQEDECIEAILDMVYRFPCAGAPRQFDVAIRCPFAKRYNNTSESVAVDSIGGESDSEDCYGRSVWPLNL